MTNVVAVALPEPNAPAMEIISAPQPVGSGLVIPGDERQEDIRSVQVARAFFEAATRLSEDNEDILPQVCEVRFS
jgi:hypothetical protein